MRHLAPGPSSVLHRNTGHVRIYRRARAVHVLWSPGSGLNAKACKMYTASIPRINLHGVLSPQCLLEMDGRGNSKKSSWCQHPKEGENEHPDEIN
jgi:hypothetical protein